MTTNITKWGNSQGIRLPKVLLDNVNMSENDTVEVLAENGVIIIKKAKPAKQYKSLKQHLEEFYGEDIEDILKKADEEDSSSEINWGRPKGREIW